MNLLRVSVPLAFVFGCASGQPSTGTIAAEVSAAEALDRSQALQVQAMELDVNRLMSGFAEADEAYDRAAADFATAQRSADRASDAFRTAAAHYEEASRRYQQMLALVVFAATWDLGGAVCDGIQSTASYRREFGVQQGMCVDHVFPHTAGGVNQAWNYMVIDCALNSSLGDKVWSKLVAEPVPMLQGMAVSALARLRCGSNPAAWKR